MFVFDYFNYLCISQDVEKVSDFSFTIKQEYWFKTSTIHEQLIIFNTPPLFNVTGYRGSCFGKRYRAPVEPDVQFESVFKALLNYGP